MTALDRTSSTPLYRQLADLLSERIESGALPADKPIAGLEEISEHYQVPLPVVRRSLQVLSEEGQLEQVAGKGLFPRCSRPVTGVLLEWDPAESRLDLAGHHEVRVLSKVMTTLPRELLHTFEVHGKSGNQASRIVKLHSMNAQPKALEIILSPLNELPGLLMRDHRHLNLFRLIEGDYHLRLTSLVQHTGVRPLLAEEAKYLGSTEEFPALSIRQVLVGERTPLAMVEWVVPGGRCDLVTEGRAARRRRK
jgi:DNA-binding GntR family transcriptional regulator